MKAWALVETGKPLELIELPTPQPIGDEVLIEVTHCGVCHSDLHFWKGEYNLGGGKILKLADRGVVLPRAPGHEVVGRVAAMGSTAKGVEIGDVRIVYPWIGCGNCPACESEQDNQCLAQKSIGVVRHGGFSSHVVVPHARYLVDPGYVDPALAATFACSGITAYSAVRKVMPLDADTPVVLIGAGGVGLTAIAMLQALGHRAIFSVDISAEKRAAAAEAGAVPIDGSAENVASTILAATGGPVQAVLDFVNISSTARTGFDCLNKGGTLVAVGVSGGELTLSLAGLVFRANTVMGSNTGDLQDLRDVVALANSGKLKPTPISTCSKHGANSALTDLKEGRITGRTVLIGEP